VEGAVFDLPDRLDEPLAAEPTIGQHIVRLNAVLDRPLACLMPLWCLTTTFS